jgi:hypothetical protein
MDGGRRESLNLFAMKLLHSVCKQGLGLPLFALFAASATCCALVVYRILGGAEVRHAYLVWNLFLAWLPLVFALFAVARFSLTYNVRDRQVLLLGIAWLLFFPNAPYIFTDLVHVLAQGRPTFWTELMLILIVALTGFLAGFLSLQIMHGLATRWGPDRGLVVCGRRIGPGRVRGVFGALHAVEQLGCPVESVATGAAHELGRMDAPHRMAANEISLPVQPLPAARIRDVVRTDAAKTNRVVTP